MKGVGAGALGGGALGAGAGLIEANDVISDLREERRKYRGKTSLSGREILRDGFKKKNPSVHNEIWSHDIRPPNKTAGLRERVDAAKAESSKGAMIGGGLSAAHQLYDEDSPRNSVLGLKKMKRSLSRDDAQNMWQGIGRGATTVLSDLGAKAAPGAVAGGLIGGAKGFVFPRGVLNTVKDTANKLRGGPNPTRKKREEPDPNDIWEESGPME